MNTIKALEKIREGYKLKHTRYYDLKTYDYIAWSIDDKCVCGFKDGNVSATEITIVIDDLYKEYWEIVEDKK